MIDNKEYLNLTFQEIHDAGGVCLTSERKRILVPLQKQLKRKLYEPDSGIVIKIKKRFETMCMEFENK